MRQLVMYIAYGIIAGFSQFTPLSASAHQALFSMLFPFDSAWPMLRFCVHLGSLAALVFVLRTRLTHIYREMQLRLLPARSRKRPPDMDAVLDASISMMAIPPMLISAILTMFLYRSAPSLFSMAACLILSGVLIYIPDYLPSGDRRTGAMTRLEGFLFGTCAGLSVCSGFSAMGLMLSVGLLLKCDRTYLLELVLLICGVLLAELILADMVNIVITGFSGFTMRKLIKCFFAAFAAFGGGIAGIMMVRHLAVKTGFYGFAFYNWGLGLFSLILYLMV